MLDPITLHGSIRKHPPFFLHWHRLLMVFCFLLHLSVWSPVLQKFAHFGNSFYIYIISNMLCSVLDSITLHCEMFSWFVAATIATDVQPMFNQCSTNAISATRWFVPGRQAMIHHHAFSTLTFWKIIVHRCKVNQLELRYIVEFCLALTP